MTAKIKARTRVAGLHYWPGAEGVRSYLSQPHRHEFQVSVTAEVRHDDRDIEFHDLRHAMDAAIRHIAAPGQGGLLNFGGQSCETLARKLWEQLEDADLRGRLVEIVWSEDGEFDAIVTA